MEENRNLTIAPQRTAMELLAEAMDKNMSAETIEKMMALAERMEANSARRAYDSALAEFKASNIIIGKNKQVGYTSAKGRVGYSHATLDNVVSEITPALSAVGLSFTWKTEQDGAKIRVTCVVRHRLGHSEETSLESTADDTGNKNKIQALGSTVTYLQRYTLISALGLATADQVDDDGRSSGPDPVPEFITADEIKKIEAALVEIDRKPDALCKWLGIESLAYITHANLDRVWKRIESTKKAA